MNRTDNTYEYYPPNRQSYAERPPEVETRFSTIAPAYTASPESYYKKPETSKSGTDQKIIISILILILMIVLTIMGLVVSIYMTINDINKEDNQVIDNNNPFN